MVADNEIRAGDSVSLPERARLRLSPLAPDDARRLGLRGVTIHWYEPVDAPLGHRTRRRKSPQIEPQQRYARIPFSAIRDDHADQPPNGPDEYRRYALMAYAIVATSHAIPSNADVRYEVCYG